MTNIIETKSYEKFKEEFTLMLEAARKALNIKDVLFFAVVDKEDRMHVLTSQLMQSDGPEEDSVIERAPDGCWWYRRGRRMEDGSLIESFRKCIGAEAGCQTLVGTRIPPEG